MTGSTPARFADRYGLPLSTSSATAAARYVDGIDVTLSGNAGADELLAAAVAADEGFALAQAALARAEQFRGQVAPARTRAARARALAASLTARERGHVEAIAVAVEGNNARALELVREHVREFPRDAFVLSQASGVYGLIGFSGRQERNEEQFALMDSVTAAYGDDWWFLSAYAFAANELFQTERARRLVERSLELYPRNGHAAHTMGHVFFETGDDASGASFLGGWLPGYDPAAQLHCHLSWHWALFELNAGNHDTVLELYDGCISPAASRWNALGTVADGASLLWRCDLYGPAIAPERWQALRDYAAKSFGRPGVTFADVHCALTYAASGDEASLSQLIDGLRAREAAGKQPAGPVVVRLALGVAAFRRGDAEEAVRQIAPVADQVIRIGGSHAQREVIEDTLLEAYVRSGRAEEAAALLRERLDRRPSPRDHSRLAGLRPAAAADGAPA